jgi:hypothetical protein
VSSPLAFNTSGGGLRDFDRRASSCRKGIGEKSGVLGTEESRVGKKDGSVGALEGSVPASEAGGTENASQEDVTNKDFSKARRYFPMLL